MATEHEEKLGTEDSKWLGEYSQVHMNVFGTPLRVMDHGQGAHIWDVDGNEYLDFLAGIAVNSLGYAHPKWVKAVADQAAKVAHISNYFASEPQIELASKLVKLAGAPEGSKVYFGNSGAEGNEAALIKGEIDAVQSDNTLIKLLAEIFNTDHIPLPPEMVPCMS